MMTPATEGTRERLIAAAGPIFARDGFSRSSIRDICEAAGGANVASIKYHFGDKTGLYREVVLQGIATMQARRPQPDLSLAPAARLSDWLRQFLELTLIYRRNHPYITNVMKHELREPTEMLDIIVREVIEPMHAMLARIIAEIRGGADSRHQAGLLLSACANLETSRPVLERLGATLPSDPAAIQAFAAQLTHAVLHGISPNPHGASEPQ
jgi:AcrR family transcriptional regulator